LAAANNNTSPVTMNFWQFEGAHEFGHNLGFAHVSASELNNSVMADGLTYSQVQNWSKPNNMLSGDNIAFRGKYKISESDPDNPCDQQNGGGGTDSTVIWDSGWYECWVDVTIEDHYFLTENGWEYAYSVYYYGEPYNCHELL
jgi:hypothetical protein